MLPTQNSQIIIFYKNEQLIMSHWTERWLGIK